MILTVTPNTAVDHVMEVEQLVLGAAQRCGRSARFAAGKGINVSRALSSLGLPSLALGFVGRADLELFQSLESKLLAIELIALAGETRVNVSILDRSRNETTHLINPGYRTVPADLQALAHALERRLMEGVTAVFSGSLPPGAPSSYYAELIDICRRHGARAVLDTSGEALHAGTMARPYMIKPNLEELESLTGARLRGERDIAQAAVDIAGRGIEFVVVSRGAEGIVIACRNEQRAWKARIAPSSASAAFSKVGSDVGSGDALVAGFVAGLREKRDFQQTVRIAVACGAANLMHGGPGLLHPNDVSNLMARVEIEPFEL